MSGPDIAALLERLGTAKVLCVGDIMLDRICGKPGDFGARLTPDTVGSRIQEVHDGLQAYRKQRPEDVEFLQTSLERYR